MAVPDTRADTADTWRTDLWWHRKGFMGARWRWWGSHIVDMTLELTGGRLNFTTVADLRRAHNLLIMANENAATVQMSLCAPLSAAKQVLVTVEAVAEEEIGLDLVELREIHNDSLWREIPQAFPGEVLRVKKAVAKQIFKNPLIELLELTQVLRQYQAVASMLNDVVWDLTGELRPTRPISVLDDALGHRYNIDGSLAYHRAHRGKPDDPCRVPRQILSRPQGSAPVLRSR